MSCSCVPIVTFSLHDALFPISTQNQRSFLLVFYITTSVSDSLTVPPVSEGNPVPWWGRQQLNHQAQLVHSFRSSGRSHPGTSWRHKRPWHDFHKEKKKEKPFYWTEQWSDCLAGEMFFFLFRLAVLIRSPLNMRIMFLLDLYWLVITSECWQEFEDWNLWVILLPDNILSISFVLSWQKLLNWWFTPGKKSIQLNYDLVIMRCLLTN